LPTNGRHDPRDLALPNDAWSREPHTWLVVAGLNRTMPFSSSGFYWFVALLLAVLGVAIAVPSSAQSGSADEPVPQLPSSPNIRLEALFHYQENADHSGQYKLTNKIYVPLGSSGGWHFTGRVDVPLLYTNKEGNGNPNGDWKFHVGDSLTELDVAAPPVSTNLKLGGSLRLVWPTGGQPPFGSEQYQWAPSLYLSYQMPDFGYGMTVRPLARYFMSYHANTAGAGKIRRLDLYPTVTFDLPDRWFIAFYPENPIKYNEITRQWFVPFEAMLGKAISERLRLRFGGAFKLGGNDTRYNYLLEALFEWRF